MPMQAKIDPIEKSTVAMISAAALPAMQKAAADYARDEISKADQINQRVLGRVPPKTVTVDGHEGAPLDSVKPDGGTIIVEWEIVSDVLIWIARTLEDRSPVQSGEYKRSHTLLADGVEVPVSGNIPPANEYIFVNTTPYARKIEMGRTKSGRAFIVQVPNHIYERTAKDARSRFGNIAKITFSMQSISGGALGRWAGSAMRRTGGGSRHRRQTGQKLHDWLTRQPVIIVRLK